MFLLLTAIDRKSVISLKMGRFSLSFAISTDNVFEGAVVNPASRTIRTQMYVFSEFEKCARDTFS